ncbi:MAG: LVIVD repeat-containing protein [Acidobacteriota bacterium]
MSATSSRIRTRGRAARLGWALGAGVVLFVGALQLGAQERPATSDPRVGLKPGFRDAGVAARNLELVSSLGKPEGFFDPKSPAGPTSPPEPSNDAAASGPPAPAAPPAGPPQRPRETAESQAPTSGLNFANSDLAFSGNHVFMGSYHGFTTYDIENTRRPRLLASIVCPGGQGDVSIWGHLLFMSVEQNRGRLDCGVQGVLEPVSAERFRGVRIFDITDIRKPRQVAAVQTCRGSHTHTLVPDPKDKAHIYVYGSGTGPVRPGEELAGCSGEEPEKDANTALFSIDVIKVPLAAPEKAAIVNRPRIFADPATGNVAGLWPGGDHGPGTQRTSRTNQCHDITVFPEVGLAAGACSGNGILMDISDPEHPVRLDHVSDKNFAYWHSATFNNDGTKIIFTDEWGGGTRPRCRASDPPSWGANAIFDIVDRKMSFGGYYKLPAAQSEQENCVAHNGSLIPVPGRDIMVQGWYQGGLTVFDFTDSTKPIEIAYFDRGPLDAKNLITGGYWSAYWYNGHIYGAEIARGIDIFRLTPSEFLTQNEIDAAVLARFTEFNAQQQPKVSWPATTVVAKAYVDQLARASTLPPARIAAIRALLDRADRVRSAQDRNAAAVTGDLQSLAADLERVASSATGHDMARLNALADTLKGRAERLR